MGFSIWPFDEMALSDYGILILILNLILATWVSCHALLTKSNPRAALSWMGLAFLAPLLGSMLYFLLGINRVNTRAQKLAHKSPFRVDQDAGQAVTHIADPANLPCKQELAQVAHFVSGIDLLTDNKVDCLHNGENAYPAMLEAMEQAQESLFFTTYIFETKQAGKQFIETLVRAKERGVDVRVIIDGVGELTNLPRASTLLMRHGIRTARFIPPRLLPPSVSLNLRNHRKILVIDGQIAFTGGMNITYKHYANDEKNNKRMTDMQFRLQGPVAYQIQQAFLEDWSFVTDERDAIQPQRYQSYGDVCCRALPDGPNEYLDQLTKVLSGVICCAEERIGIITPYFLPPRSITAVLQAAAMRGVKVDIILPEVSDNPIVQWATRHILSFLLDDGIHFYFQPAPFCHSKLLLIDDCYTMIGSANLDPRSLRLNFEMGVEVFSKSLNNELWDHFDEILKKSKKIQLKALQHRSLPHKLRDSLAWVCSPYL